MTAKFLFSTGLNRMIKRTGCTLEQLSNGSGVSIRQIKRLVAGECFPSTDKVITGISRFFGVEESDILAFGFGLMGEE